MRTVSTRFIRGSEAIPILATRSRAESSCLSRRSRPDDSHAPSFSDDASMCDAPLRVCVRLTALNHSFFDLRVRLTAPQTIWSSVQVIDSWFSSRKNVGGQ